MRHLLLLGLLAASLSGCASDPAPLEQMRLTEQTLDQARAVGATATLEEMRQAEAKFARAQKNMGEADYKRARQFAEQAELDARLAEAKVLTAKSEQELKQINLRIKRVRQQLGTLP